MQGRSVCQFCAFNFQRWERVKEQQRKERRAAAWHTHLRVHHLLGLQQLLPHAKRQQTLLEEARHARVVALELLDARDVCLGALQERQRQLAPAQE